MTGRFDHGLFRVARKRWRPRSRTACRRNSAARQPEQRVAGLALVLAVGSSGPSLPAHPAAVSALVSRASSPSSAWRAWRLSSTDLASGASSRTRPPAT